jgi:hypothetical protein
MEVGILFEEYFYSMLKFIKLVTVQNIEVIYEKNLILLTVVRNQ